MDHEAMYWDRAEGGAVNCRLCPHHCHILSGGTGLCHARQNRDGVLYTLNYGQVTGLALDPMEKKPLKRFRPGSLILSAGSFGCNLRCPFCQNWSISQRRPPAEDFSPQQLVDLALTARDRGSIGLAYTYNEPSIWYEYVLDCARLAHERGLLNVLVTNGFIEREPMVALLPLIDAMNIDLKSFDPRFYRDLCHGRLGPVLDTIALCAAACHVEVTTLIIPGENDGEEGIANLAAWLAGLSPDIPLHLSRYHPAYEMKEPPPTPPETVRRLAVVARRSLKYVYEGNM